MDALIDQQRAAVDQVQGLLEELHRHPNTDPSVLQKLSRDSLLKAAEDLDLFVCLGINPTGNSTIFSHSMNVASLAVALGVTLGLDETSLCDLGTGCLVHDAGMLHIDQNAYQSKHVLDAHEFVEIAKHPIIAADLLYKNMQQVPVGVRMIVYQMHERCDGSGYPRGSTGGQIHPLAKIAMVADAYVALVSERPHRPALLPYHAIAKMLTDVRDGLFDATVVRALVHTISLFPIGSFVELADGRVGKTIRANGPAYDRPIVEIWQRTNLSAAPEVVDLLATESQRVVKPLTSLH
jgi:HD-GYP domain-containing protein (c-di-GMP phosphodiesterase class II)